MADTSTKSETLFTLVFWGVLVVIGLFSFFEEDHVDILLDVSTQPESVSGMVTFAGTPVPSGVVHIVVSEVRGKRYLTGTTLSVSNGGKFTWQGQPTLGIAQNSHPLRLSAEFHGTLVQKENDESKGTPLYGKSTLYLNSSPPLGERFLWGVATVVVLFLAILLTLFTGGLGQKKARWLFILMYFFTFLSLAWPIAVSFVVAQNPYLVDLMETSPIGLVKAKTRVLDEPQWLINIGGTVAYEAKNIGDTAAHEVKLVATKTMPVPDSNVPDEAATSTEPTAGTDVSSPPAVASVDTSEPIHDKVVTGGVALPFYVVLLAMFGAGINMTLKVPEIQRSYEDVLLPESSSLWLNPLLAVMKMLKGKGEAQEAKAKDVPRKTAGDIRRELIENYMYLLSAPFLAIGMYYFLQILAEQVTQPVLVLMAFATGLVSKAVIKGIIDFAEGKLVSSNRRENVASTASETLEVATATQTAAETAATGGVTQAEADTTKEEADEVAQGAAAEQVEAEKTVEVKIADAGVAAKASQSMQPELRLGPSEQER